MLYAFTLQDIYTESGSQIIQGPTQALNQFIQPGLYSVNAYVFVGADPHPTPELPVQATTVGNSSASLVLTVDSGNVIPGAPEPAAWLLTGLGLLAAIARVRRRARRG